MAKQLTNNILMVVPNSFGYNPETAETNPAQRKVNLPDNEITEIALHEFYTMVNILESSGVNVIILEHSPNKKLYDAVFPNNWFTTHEDGTLILYPMLSKNRRLERDINLLESVLKKHGFVISKKIDLTYYENENIYLEGTGSLILSRNNNAAFASKSARTNEKLFNTYCEYMNINEDNRIYFETYDENDLVPPYHTNIIMSIGNGFAVICSEYISNSDKNKVLSKIESLNLEVIEITKQQCKEYYCGNVLNIKNNNDESLIVMSNRAYLGFEWEQIQKLKKYGRIICADIKMIEDVGGGSSRCMIAEIFLPKK